METHLNGDSRCRLTDFLSVPAEATAAAEAGGGASTGWSFRTVLIDEATQARPKPRSERTLLLDAKCDRVICDWMVAARCEM